MSARWLIALALWLATSMVAVAHEVRPALLDITETQVGAYDVTWKQPAAGGLRLALSPTFPADCRAVAAPERSTTDAFIVSRWRMACGRGLANRSVRIEGLERTLTSVIVRVRWADGRDLDAVVQPASASLVLEQAQRPGAPGYLGLGVHHILSGYDHILFVFGLIVLAQGWRRLLGAVTAFTAAHSITLGASALGLVSLPQASVEAVIALSIAALGYEIVRLARGRAGLTAQAPWIVAFCFGLLHGFGFASALAEIGLPEGARLAALLFFNVGVEAGQLMAVWIAAPVVWWLRGRAPPVRRGVETAIGYGVGIAGATLLLSRVGAVLFG